MSKSSKGDKKKKKEKSPKHHPKFLRKNFYVKVNRTEDSGSTLIDYLRLGGPSDDAMYDRKTTIEDHAIDGMTGDGAMDDTLSNMGAAGKFAYTPGSNTAYVAGDSFERVKGDVYKTFGPYHEVILSSDDSDDDEDDGKSKKSKKIYKISGTKSLTPLDFGYGTYYELKQGADYYLKTCLSLNYESSLKYECKLTGSIAASLSVKFDLSVGTSLKDIKAKFSCLGFSAQIDGKGNFKSSNSLNVSSKVQTLAKEKIVLSLSDSISQTTWESGIWKTLLALAQTANAAYVAMNIAVTVNFQDYQDSPSKLKPWLTGMQIIAVAQGAIGLVFAAAAAIHDKWFNDQVDNIKSNVGNPVYGKPFIQILPDDSGTIELNTGQGASLVLKGSKAYINADGIELQTGTPSTNIANGIVLYSGDDQIQAFSGVGGAYFGSTGGSTQMTGTSMTLTAYNNGSITSNASKWTHNGELEAGKTTLGDVTATSVASTGGILPIATPVPPPAPTTVSITTISLYVNVVNVSDVAVLIGEL